MTIEVATRELHGGGTLSGTVTAIPTVQHRTRGLRVQLVRERHEHGIVDREITASTALIGEYELRPGEPITAPFEIALAADASPCWEAEHNSQHWYLEAVVELPMRSDEVTRIELLVN
jgi:hypothetical protein